MSAPDPSIERRLRAAYERGRLAAALRRGLLLAPVVGVALWGCAAAHDVLTTGVVLIVAVTALLWRGQEYGEGVGPGVAAGLVPLLVPVAIQSGGHAHCSSTACYILPAACALGGLIGGVLLGAVAPVPRPGRRVAFVVACSVAALMGAVGCLLYGLVGLVVMGAGLAAGATPLLAARRIRA
jgi:hypothetical protein